MDLFQAVEALVDLTGEQFFFLAQMALHQPKRAELAVELIGEDKRTILNVTAVTIADGGGVARDLAAEVGASAKQRPQTKKNQQPAEREAEVLESHLAGNQGLVGSTLES
ncbi:MAG: hypothetical protein ACR2IE_18945 [Candidatus Sumerlaeaceae bacterium]